MLSDQQRHDMLPAFRLACYHEEMSKIAYELGDFASANFHHNEHMRLLKETMEIGGFVKEE